MDMPVFEPAKAAKGAGPAFSEHFLGLPGLALSVLYLSTSTSQCWLKGTRSCRSRCDIAAACPDRQACSRPTAVLERWCCIGIGTGSAGSEALAEVAAAKAAG